MLFHDCTTAPSPRRVRIFLAEKGIVVPTVQVDLRNGEHLQPGFRKINPECTVPVLVLDDGTAITDAIAICHYFEELQPDPPLIGATPTERAQTIAWNRRIERDGFYAVMEAFRNATPGLKGRAIPGPDDYEQIPALAEPGSALLRGNERASGCPRVRGRQPLHDCRHLDADRHRVRQVGQGADSGELSGARGLVRASLHPPQRQGLSGWTGHRPGPYFSGLNSSVRRLIFEAAPPMIQRS